MPPAITKGTAPWSTASPPTPRWPASPESPETSPRPRHTGPVATRVTSSRMVGRTAELQQLEDAPRDASAGRPSLAFVAGESGVGDNPLAPQLPRTAGHRRAAAPARPAAPRAAPPPPIPRGGAAVELVDGAVPYPALMPAPPPPS